MYLKKVDFLNRIIESQDILAVNIYKAIDGETMINEGL